MIVPSMTFSEIIEDILPDYDQVIKKSAYLLMSLRRQIIKLKKLVWSYTKYVVQNAHNEHIIICCYCHRDPAFIFASVYLNNQGLNAIMWDGNKINSFTHFTPHFLARYNERFLHQPDLSKMEILKVYLTRNPISAHITEINNQIFAKVNDGIVLGKADVTSDTTQFILKHLY